MTISEVPLPSNIRICRTARLCALPLNCIKPLINGREQPWPRVAVQVSSSYIGEQAETAVIRSSTNIHFYR